MDGAGTRVECRCRIGPGPLATTNANGGYLVPFTPDPTVNLTNAGVRNAFRQISRVEQSATGTWHGVASAGVTAEWLAEGAAAADASPTFWRVTIPTYKGAAYLFGSDQLLQHSNLAARLPELLSDACANLDNTAFAAGAGSTEPTGVVTGVYATTDSMCVLAVTSDAVPIVDRIGPTLVHTPSVTDSSTGRPTGQAGWFAYGRIGSAVLEFSQIRVLVTKDPVDPSHLGRRVPQRKVNRPPPDSFGEPESLPTPTHQTVSALADRRALITACSSWGVDADDDPATALHHYAGLNSPTNRAPRSPLTSGGTTTRSPWTPAPARSVQGPSGNVVSATAGLHSTRN